MRYGKKGEVQFKYATRIVHDIFVDLKINEISNIKKVVKYKEANVLKLFFFMKMFNKSTTNCDCLCIYYFNFVV